MKPNKFGITSSRNSYSQPEKNDPVEFCQMIGQSPEILQIFSKVNKIAKANSSVLIVGETGTGKELLARAIHANSKQSSSHFIPIDCNALPPTLLESELFGFEKGAFTGAQVKKIGLIELATRGTLFLDEITEIDMSIQSKFLRFLQERKIRRIGGLKEIPVETRIIAACNKDPFDLIEQKKFREDLYYRLNVIRFDKPPLRKRKQDIPDLIDHFIKKHNKSTENEIIGIEDSAFNLLMEFDWPGNVRQLENAIEYSVIMAKTDKICIDDFPDYLKNITSSQKVKVQNRMKFKDMKRQCIERFEKEYIIELLNRHNYNISQAARTAGINRRTIYRMMEMYSIK